LKQVAFYDGLLPELARLPGVQAVGAVGPLPLSGQRYSISFELPGHPAASAAERLNADFAFASPGYFRAMRIPLRQGREFAVADDDAAPRVVVINERFAQQYFPGQDPIGKRMKPGLSTTEHDTPWREIVGVAGNIKQQAVNEAVTPAYFVPYGQGLLTTPHIVLRVAGAPDAIIESVRRTIAANDRELAVHDIESMEEYLTMSMASPKFETSLLTLFAALGLVLTAVGLYGVLAYGVVQRTHEFGVRFALGARPRDVLTMVVRGAIELAGTGLLLGILAAAATARALARALDFVDPTDGTAFAAVAMILLAVAAVAAYAPARRAAHVDPMLTLRAE
jgi:putative ABC transport system permease protein